MVDQKRYEYVLCHFYTKVSGDKADRIEQIPVGRLEVLSCLEFSVLATPLVKEMLARGTAVNAVAEFTGLARSSVYAIIDKFKL
ncbi:MAG: hypothetical protein AAFU67_18840 [Bacteroidota bacterium]